MTHFYTAYIVDNSNLKAQQTKSFGVNINGDMQKSSVKQVKAISNIYV